MNSKGPGIRPGLQLDFISGFVDLAPTLVTLASGVTPTDTDGRSFAHLLDPTLPKPVKPWKTVHLTTYQSINSKECIWDHQQNPCGRHPVDAEGNTHTSIRLINSTHNLLCEFTLRFAWKSTNQLVSNSPN
eukprot:SAG22_NODE_72_length_22344_cov_95.586559_7_plen_131_part_00